MGGALATEAVLARLVGFDTTSERSNLPLIDWVEDYLRGLGLAPVRIPDPSMPKAALFVTIGPEEQGGVCLSGHTDVVPVAGQAWTSDPFTLAERDGRLHGRGACDMKGFLACCLARVPAMQAAGLRTPIHLVLSYDEEVTCAGVIEAVRRFGTDVPMPRLCIVGEPTLMEVADAHKSVVGFDTEITGREAHSSMPESGASALVAGAMIVAELERLAAEMRGRGDPSGRFDPPYTTVHAGMFESGTARNIVPNRARLRWEFRGLPDLDPEEIPARVRRFVEREVLPMLRRPGAGAEVRTERTFVVPALGPEQDAEAARLALRLAGSNRVVTAPYGTEAGHFQGAGISTVVCGPGSIEQAHKPDEFIAASELRRCEAFLDGLVEQCRSGS